MKFKMTMHAYWDRANDERVVDFKQKLDALKLHVARMQAAGTFPRGEVRWVIRRTEQPSQLPPVMTVDGVPAELCEPEIAHEQGRLLTMPFNGLYAPM